MDYSDFCSICFAGKKLYNICTTDNVNWFENFKSLIELKDITEKGKVYLCSDCSKKLEAVNGLKENCISSLTLYRDLYVRVKPIMEQQNVKNIQPVMQDLILQFRNNVCYQFSQENTDLCVNESPTVYDNLGQGTLGENATILSEDCLENIKVEDIFNTSNSSENLPHLSMYLNLSSTAVEFHDERSSETPCFPSTSREIQSPNMEQKRKNSSAQTINSNAKSPCVTYTNQQKRFIPGQEPYKCNTCSKCFVNSTYLEKHKKTHFIQKIYKCKICEVDFKNRSSLIQHKRTHVPDKNDSKKRSKKSVTNNNKNIKKIKEKFECKICNTSFQQESHLFSHQLLHCKENIYECAVCKQVFLELKDLGIHIQTHDLLSLYTCNYCNKLFSDLNVFNRHMNTIHSNNDQSQ